MFRSYLGTKDVEAGGLGQDLDIISHVNGSYPATYITDGNQPDTFPEHAKAMADALRRNAVDHEFNYYGESVPLGHNYTERLDTRFGRDNLQKTIAFLKRRTGMGSSARDGADARSAPLLPR